MGYALKIYEAFRDLGEDKASVLAEFVEYVESRKSATSEELKETELKLQKEIEQVRLEVEQVRKELKETELKLQKEISETKASLIKWMFLFWIGQIIAFAGLLKFMLH